MSETEPISVWLIEDHAPYRRAMERALSRTPGMVCPRSFGNCEDAVAALASEPAPALILLDLGLPGMNGLDAIPILVERAPDVRVVVLTVFEDEDKIFRALCAGAHGYLLKGQPVERIVTGIREAAAGGAPMSASVARRVLDRFVPRAALPPESPLTDLERRVLETAADGLSKKMIADRLDMNPHSVDAALRRVYSKLHVHNRGGAVAKALKEGLLPRP